MHRNSYKADRWCSPVVSGKCILFCFIGGGAVGVTTMVFKQDNIYDEFMLTSITQEKALAYLLSRSLCEGIISLNPIAALLVSGSITWELVGLESSMCVSLPAFLEGMSP